MDKYVKNNKRSLTVEEVQKELDRLRRKKSGGFFKKLIIMMVILIAIILALSLFLPITKISDTSMEPIYKEGDMLIYQKKSGYERNDVIAFTYNDKILVKRIIALPGDWIEIDKDGKVWVNGKEFEEAYSLNRAKGECDITFPYEVPEDSYFVMGDQRASSKDSRNSTMGCIEMDKIKGLVSLRLWPLK